MSNIYKTPGVYTRQIDVCSIPSYSKYAPKWYVRRIKLGCIFGFPVPEKYWGGTSTGSSGVGTTGTTGTTGTSGSGPVNKPIKVNSAKEFNSIFGKVRVNTNANNRKYQNNRRYN